MIDNKKYKLLYITNGKEIQQRKHIYLHHYHNRLDNVSKEMHQQDTQDMAVHHFQLLQAVVMKK